MSETVIQQLFPELAKFVEKSDMLRDAKGFNASRLPKILGQGKTSATGLDLPPSKIERRQILASLKLPKEALDEPGVRREIEEAKRLAEEHVQLMRHHEHQRRFALRVLHKLKDVKTGEKDNNFFAGRFVLVPEKNGLSWSWSLTPHHPMVPKIPADEDYVVKAHEVAERLVEEWTMPADQFAERLSLAWVIAKSFTKGENILIDDVARVFKIAAQDNRFWKSPASRNFKDVPDAVFIINLINWRHDRQAAEKTSFELVPATLNQAHGPKSRAFFVPGNAEGTSVRPMIYIRRSGKKQGEENDSLDLKQ